MDFQRENVDRSTDRMPCVMHVLLSIERTVECFIENCSYFQFSFVVIGHESAFRMKKYRNLAMNPNEILEEGLSNR